MSDRLFLSRRRLLSTGLVTGAGLLTTGLARASTQDESCALTPRQILGPFFPDRKREDEDLDLTHVAGRSSRAEGEVVCVQVQVLDEQCRPVEGALVDLWQANKWGRYDHERDARNPRPLDLNFQGWARVVTGEDGRFRVKTIKPGSYPADNTGWVRPPHIHFRVSRRGYHELVTQMYFAGEPLNDVDLLLQGLPAEEQTRLTVHFAPSAGTNGEPMGRFDLTLRHA